MWMVLGTGLSPVSLVAGDVAALSWVTVHAQPPGGGELSRDTITVTAATWRLSAGIPLGHQTPSKENKMDDQLGVLRVSRRSRSTVWWRMRNTGWKAGGTARDEAREAGLESRGGRTFLQHWLWQCSGIVGLFAGGFMVCGFRGVLEVPPRPHCQFAASVGSSQIAVKAKMYCCSQMDGESVWRDHLKGRHKSPQQYSISQIYFCWWLTFPWQMGIWWAGSFVAFLNGSMAAFLIWQYVCVHVW